MGDHHNISRRGSANTGNILSMQGVYMPSVVRLYWRLVACFLLGCLLTSCIFVIMQSNTALYGLSPLLPFTADIQIAASPPMGWRSWRLYGGSVNQSVMTLTMNRLVSKARLVDNKHTSLCDIGYCDIGLDDGWQSCGGGDSRYSYHSSAGVSVVNHISFPAMKDMVDAAHKLGLTISWYFNNCICPEMYCGQACYEGDVSLLVSMGYDGVRLDECGSQTDLGLWYELLRDSDEDILIENSHNGLSALPSMDHCLYHTYRISPQPMLSFGSIMFNMLSLLSYADSGLSRPSCWAHLGELLIGHNGLTDVESRSQFGVWCILSSPLILSLDLQNDIVLSHVWPVISHTEVIAINQKYFGFSGSRLAEYGPVSTATGVGFTGKESIIFNTTQVLYKPMSFDGSKVAVLLLNAGSDNAIDITLEFGQIPSFQAGKSVIIRDVWARTNIAMTSEGYYILSDIQPHDCVFLMITAIY